MELAILFQMVAVGALAIASMAVVNEAIDKYMDKLEEIL